MLRKNKGAFRDDAIRSGIIGWFFVFPSLFFLLWATGNFDVTNEPLQDASYESE